MRVLLATLALSNLSTACAKPAEQAAAPGVEAPPAPADLHPREEDEAQPKTIDDFRAETLAAIDKDACAAKGGEVRQEGLLGAYRCTVPYADAGKACRGEADCDGKCLLPAESEAVTGDDAVGACQATDSPFGCYAEIEGGKVAAALCVD